jgi:hypothetical protein
MAETRSPREPRPDFQWSQPGCGAAERIRIPARPAQHMRVNIRETVQVSSLKMAKLQAQGFNLGLGSSRRPVLIRAPGSSAPSQIEIIDARLFMLAALSGRILRGKCPGLQPISAKLTKR